jgi:hypothetical protein
VLYLWVAPRWLVQSDGEPLLVLLTGLSHCLIARLIALGTVWVRTS